MSSRSPARIIKALILGFFCCLAFGDEIKEQEASRAPLLALRKVHPQNGVLAPLVGSGEKNAPPGYLLSFLADKESGKQPMLLSKKTIITHKGVKLAMASSQFGTIDVMLTKKAGKRLKNATGQMRMGLDRIAVVLEGKCIIAPTVQAVLSDHFLISGLGGKEEVKRIVLALNAPIKKAPSK